MSELLKIFNAKEWVLFRNGFFEKAQGNTLGFVPTMGALHKGHLSLIQRSKQENDYTLVSIFVNPTQFDDKNDLEKYPRMLDTDIELLSRAKVNFVLVPSASEMYQDDYKYQIEEVSLSRDLCGASRQGHFKGMLTVVMKLLMLAKADRAYFGEKDYQQFLLVKGMKEAFFLSTDILACPTVRDSDGLAMSSRNSRLTDQERALAPQFSKLLRDSGTAEEARLKLIESGFSVDYVDDRLNRRFGAVKLGETRLIDNVPR